jgi:hypothetical protein
VLLLAVRRVRSRRGRAAWRLGIVVLAASLPNSRCDRSVRTEPKVDVSWTLSPSAAVVGPALLTITLRRPSGDAVKGATVRLEGHMSHAGMTPVLANATERAPGVYDVSFAFTMRGDWVLLVSVALPDGGRVDRRINVANVQPSG